MSNQRVGGIRNLKIGMQLRIALSAILILVLLLGAVSWFQADSLWQNTKDLYDHPFAVRRAIGELEADALYIYRGMKDLLLVDSEQKIETILQEIDTYEANAARQIEVLYKSYLGPRPDIDEVQNALMQWKTIRAETIRLLRNGKIAEATARTYSSGVGGVQAEKLMDEIRHISDFSLNKADTFYADAHARKEKIFVTLAVLLGAILLVAIVTINLLTQAIMAPLLELTAAAEKYRLGHLDARSRYLSANEFGTLSAAFNGLAETIQTELSSKENTARIADVMLGNAELMAFCRALLPELIDRTNSNIGAVYFLQEEKKLFEPYYAIGLTQDKMRPFSAEMHEGEFGAALTGKTITQISAIPEDTVFDFATVAGSFKPKEIITIPILQNQNVIAVISLASLRPYSAESLKIINNSWKSLNIGIIGMLAFENIREYTHKLDEQASALQDQSEALRHQNKALTQQRMATEAANRELQTKNEEIQAQSEELTAQSEELTAQFIELQSQNVELNQQRLAVEEANRLKSQFLSNMSHELRTPLNSVMALSRVLMMQAGMKLSAEELNYLEIIERNGKNLLTLINDILDLSKIEAGRMDVTPQPFSLRMTLENIIESIAPLAGEKQLALRQDIPEDLPPLESDEIRVSQILQNLIANAVKFTDAGHVTVSARLDQERFFVRVSDTGIGVAEKDIPYIFDEFRQVDGTSARKHEGTGLGLTIARKAARMLGGDIAVQSAKGVGSIFTLTLPVAWQGPVLVCETIDLRQPSGVGKVDDEPEMDRRKIGRTLEAEGLDIENRPQNLQPEKPAAPPRILLVEDNEAAIIQVKSVLQSAGYVVDVAGGGQQAFDYVSHTIPEGIILDLMMPGIDGFEVLEKIRGTRATENIPVLILTAKDLTPEDFKKLSANHIQQLVQKGDVDREILLFKINDMLGTHSGTRARPDEDAGGKDDRWRITEDRKEPSSVVRRPSSDSAGPPCLLIVEDNPDNLTTIKAILQNRYRILEAADGEEGLRMASEIVPDLILLDMAMPKMDGFAVVRRIKDSKQLNRIPVIAMTARVMKGDREMILAAGCDDYISKPIDPKDCINKIAEYLP